MNKNPSTEIITESSSTAPEARIEAFKLNIAIIVGSTRPGRTADVVARWVHDSAQDRNDATFTILDLVDFDLPMLDEPMPPMSGKVIHEHTRGWGAAIKACDGFVFVTPEYNHSTSGALKNAIDFLYAEWNDKACGFVSYGVDGGVRAVEHLRLIAAELKLADVRSQVGLSRFNDIVDGSVEVGPRVRERLSTMLDEVVAWSKALQPLRVDTQDDLK